MGNGDLKRVHRRTGVGTKIREVGVSLGEPRVGSARGGQRNSGRVVVQIDVPSGVVKEDPGGS